MIHIGVISDTHGLLRKEAVQALAGSELIIHAGDVGRAEILTELGEIAPVIAVRGNVDKGAFSEALPKSAVAEAGGLRIYVLHNSWSSISNPRKWASAQSCSGIRTSQAPAINTGSCS